MILGHGIDVVEIPRMQRIIEKYGERFLEKYFDVSELEYARDLKNIAPYFASRFAAKEAFSKAAGTGFAGFGFKDVFVTRVSGEPPKFGFSEKLKTVLPGIRESDFFLSISHEKKVAVASVIWVRKN